MVSKLLKKYFLVTLAAQVVLAITNGLFILGDVSAVLTVFGFYGVLHLQPYALLFFAGLDTLSVIMDIVKVSLWGNYVLQDLLNVPATLGTFWLVLSVFGMVIKLVAVTFGLLLHREVVTWLKDPQKRSMVNKRLYNPLGGGLEDGAVIPEPSSSLLLDEDEDEDGRPNSATHFRVLTSPLPQQSPVAITEPTRYSIAQSPQNFAYQSFGHNNNNNNNAGK